ncbi:VanZ family protein [Clostridium sporogenes]|uniref:VanZ family protein n=1 Tax=Clostridium sporogenes TaxID=1509 RepID=UPI0028FEAA17|nr:VanZ family protein [Clostridium botulinum]
MESNSNKQRIMSIIISIGLWVVTTVYILALLKIILFKYGFATDLRALNLIPFSFITDFSNATMDVALMNIVGNFALFIPLGILVPALFKNISKKKTIFICFGVSLSFEIIQYIIGLGSSDIDDLILNTFGGIIGTLLYFTFLKKIDTKVQVKIGTFIFLSVFGICGILSLYLYHPSILPAQTAFVNKEVLEGLDTQSYDIEGSCIDIKDNTLFIDTNTRFFNDNYKNRNNKDGKYILNNDAKFFLEKIHYKWSPNGNIQKTTATYSKITKEELQKITKQDNHRIFLWMSNNNQCKTVLVMQRPKEH